MRATALGGLVLASMVLVATPAAAQKPRAERPTYQLGEKWIRSDGVYDLVRIEGNRYVFTRDGQQEIHLTRDLVIAKIVNGADIEIEFNPPLQISWPLEVGNAGVTQTTWSGRLVPSRYEKRVRLWWKVEAYEEIDAVAGRFAAYRVRVQFQTYDGRWEYGSAAIWYAPAIRQMVRTEWTTTSGTVAPFDPIVQALSFNVVAVDRGDTAPLRVALAQPTDGAKIGAQALTLNGKVTAGRGVARVTVTLNGKEVARQDLKGAQKLDVPLNVPLTLNEGRNVILVTATDAAGEVRQEARIVHFDKPGGAGTPTATQITALRRAQEEGGRLRAEVDALKRAEEQAAARRAQLEAQQRAEQEVAARRARELDAQHQAEAERLVMLEAQRQAARDAAERQARIEAEKRTQREAAHRRAELEAQRQAKDEEEARRRAEIERRREAGLAVVPLKVAISAPADKARVEHQSIGFTALVSGGKGVSRVLLTLNGSEVRRLDSPAPVAVVPMNFPVTLREGSNTLVVLASDAGGGIHQEVRTVYYDPVVPLTLEVRYPTDALALTQATSVVVAQASSSRGIAKLSVTVNGKEALDPGETAPRSRDVAVAPGASAARGADRSAQRSVAWTTPITLAEGANVIAITATDAAGAVRQEVRTVTYAKPVLVEAPPPADKPVPARWAVVIGVGDYEHPGINRLKYTVNDAEAVHRILIGSGGFKKEHVLLLTDRTERKPTLKNIKWALGTFLARSAKKDDTVVIFFAGHGAPEIDQRGIERDGLAKYLIPRDAEADDLYSSALPMEELQNIFGRIEAERVVMFLDTCYSGAAGGRTFAAKTSRAGNVDDLFLERLTRSKGRAIITASRPNEVSVELPDLKHGIFTYYLIEGLKGAADSNRDGIVSLQELYEYVEQQVTTKSRAVGGNQHPVMKGEIEGPLPLVRVKK